MAGYLHSTHLGFINYIMKYEIPLELCINDANYVNEISHRVQCRICCMIHICVFFQFVTLTEGIKYMNA